MCNFFDFLMITCNQSNILVATVQQEILLRCWQWWQEEESLLLSSPLYWILITESHKIDSGLSMYVAAPLWDVYFKWLSPSGEGAPSLLGDQPLWMKSIMNPSMNVSYQRQTKLCMLSWVGLASFWDFFGSFEDPWTWGHEGELVSFQNAEKH